MESAFGPEQDIYKVSDKQGKHPLPLLFWPYEKSENLTLEGVTEKLRVELSTPNHQSWLESAEYKSDKAILTFGHVPENTYSPRKLYTMIFGPRYYTQIKIKSSRGDIQPVRDVFTSLQISTKADKH